MLPEPRYAERTPGWGEKKGVYLLRDDVSDMGLVALDPFTEKEMLRKRLHVQGARVATSDPQLEAHRARTWYRPVWPPTPSSPTHSARNGGALALRRRLRPPVARSQ